MLITVPRAQALYYGGWVAPNIYFLGNSGVVQFRGLRIAGLSGEQCVCNRWPFVHMRRLHFTYLFLICPGIYKEHDFRKGYDEVPPYSPSMLRSAYHVREYELLKLSQVPFLSAPVAPPTPINRNSPPCVALAAFRPCRHCRFTRLAAWSVQLRRHAPAAS